MKMSRVEKSILVAAVSAVLGLWVASASADVAYSCYRSDITVGDSSNPMDGALYYLAGDDITKFVDELKVLWNGHSASSDLKCAGGNSYRQCYLGEDSGSVIIDLRGSSPLLMPENGQIYLGLGDGGQYYIYAAPNHARQTLDFNPVDPSICDLVFPEASKGRGREVFVPAPAGGQSKGDPTPAPVITIPINPKR
jgi:hypothetical protein